LSIASQLTTIDRKRLQQWWPW